MNKNEDLVSVIVPVYNVENYLKECVDSVINQTYKNLEIILVDDGATDNSGKICDEYAQKDSRIKVIHKENNGAADARNKGLEIASGEFVYFLDSDDYIENICLEKLVDEIKLENADFIFFNAYTFGENITKKQISNYIRKYKYPATNGAQMLNRLICLGEYKCSVCMALFNRKFLIQNNLQFKKGIIGEDELFSFLAYSYAKKVVYCPNILYYRRIRENSVMTTRQEAKRFRDYYFIYLEMKIYLSKENKTVYASQKEYIIKTLHSILLMWQYLTDEERCKHQTQYSALSKDICDNNGYGDKGLCVRIKNYKLGVALSKIRKLFKKVIEII